MAAVPDEATSELATVLDCRGMRCPLPVIELARQVRTLLAGAHVLVVAEDPAARSDLPAWCRMTGHEYLGEVVQRDGTPGYAVRLCSDGAQAAAGRGEST